MGRGKAIVGALAALALLGGACTDLAPLDTRMKAVEGKVASLETTTKAIDAKAGKIVAPAGQVQFVVSGVEMKGSTTTTSLAAPTVDPAKLSDGYRYKGPGVADKADATKWEVSTYVWSPGAMTVLQGDTVTLRIFILNGDKHTTWVEGPDGAEVVKEVEQNRGREYLVKFTASKVGAYTLKCNEHDPTMTAVITVLPRG